MTYLVTANITFLWSISSQPILHCYSLSWYSPYYIPMIYIVTVNTTLLWSILLQPILHCYNLSRYSQYYIPMIYIVTVNTTLLWSISLQSILHCYDTTTAIQLILLYTTCYNTRYEIWIQKPIAFLSINKVTTRRCWRTPPMRIPGAARRTPRQSPRLWILCYYIVFFSVLPFVLLDIRRSEDP